MNNKYTLTPKQRVETLERHGIELDRLVRESERKHITSISRTSAWALEKDGKFPARKPLGPNSCVWMLSELLFWIDNPPLTRKINNPHARRKSGNVEKLDETSINDDSCVEIDEITSPNFYQYKE